MHILRDLALFFYCIYAAHQPWSVQLLVIDLPIKAYLNLFLMTCFDLVKPHPVCNQTFLWLTTCNRDALHLKKKELPMNTLQLCSNCNALEVSD